MNIKVLLCIMGLICCTAISAEAGVITAAGSTTVQPALKACAKAYLSTDAGKQLIIAGGGSSKGVSTVARGTVDVGTASRNLKDKEKSKYPDLHSYRLATDGVVMVVNTANPLSALNSEQVKQLFNGEIIHWSGVGGSDAKVALVSLGMEHGTYELFSKFFHLKGKEYEGNIQFSKGSAWIAFSQQVALDKVARDENAITFASIGVASAFAEGTGKIKLIPLDGVAATEANVGNGSYPLTRPLLLLTKGAAQGDVKDFIDYSLRQECQGIVKKLGYIPVK